MTCVLIFVAACAASHSALADITIGGDCTSTPGAQSAQSGLGGNNVVCVSNAWQYPAYQFGNSSASCDSISAGITKYTSTHLYFCNGTAWTQLYEVQSTPAITAPAGSGYFVLSNGSWTGNLGQAAGANAKCLTDLTTNTGWMGYTDANSRGLLVAGKVRAFLCDNVTCTNLMPLTTYYFANAGDGAAGGASFTTDSSGNGPGDSNPWSAANYFSGTYNYWTNMGDTSSSTKWTGTIASSTAPCVAGNSAWSHNAGSASVMGVSTSTGYGRWDTATLCSATNKLICFVNP